MILIKNNLAVLLLPLLFLYFLLQGCGKSDNKSGSIEEHKTQKSDSVKKVTDGKFVCPMHPLEQTDELSKCSICKMKLISKENHGIEMNNKIDKMKEKFKDKVEIIKNEVKISVIKSDECEIYIIDALKKDEGIVDYNLDIINKKVSVMYDKTKTNIDKIENAIASAGFDANDKKAVIETRNKLPEECKP